MTEYAAFSNPYVYQPWGMHERRSSSSPNVQRCRVTIFARQKTRLNSVCPTPLTHRIAGLSQSATSTGPFFLEVRCHNILRCSQMLTRTRPIGLFATDVIMAYGGGAWIEYILNAGAGLNQQGIELFKAGNGMLLPLPMYKVSIGRTNRGKQLGRSTRTSSIRSR